MDVAARGESKDAKGQRDRRERRRRSRRKVVLWDEDTARSGLSVRLPGSQGHENSESRSVDIDMKKWLLEENNTHPPEPGAHKPVATNVEDTQDALGNPLDCLR